MSALIAHSQDGMPVKRHFQVLGLCLWYLRSWQFFSALLPQAFLPSGMSAPTSFSNFAALAYCFKALAWVCTVASFQLQTYLLHRFSLWFFFFFGMSATALTLGRKKDWSASSNSVYAAERCLSQMSTFTTSLAKDGGILCKDARYHCTCLGTIGSFSRPSLRLYLCFWEPAMVGRRNLWEISLLKSYVHTTVDIVFTIKVFSLSPLFNAEKNHHVERAVVFNK